MSDGGAGETPARRLTHKQAVEIALNDPAVRRAVAATESPLAIRRRQLYHENARGVFKDLAAAGFPDLQSVGDLRRGHADYAGAVPVLLEWIPKVSYLMLSEDIVRTLSVAFAKRLAAPVFLRLFREPPQEVGYPGEVLRGGTSTVSSLRGAWRGPRAPLTVLTNRGWASGAVGLLLVTDCLLKGVGPEQCVHAVQFVAPCLDQAGAGQGLEGAARQCWCHPGEGGDGSWFDAGCGVQSGEPEGSGGEIV